MTGELAMDADSNKPLVTIGIPTYNRADANLQTVVDAALSQSYSNLEVLVCDNASTDSTPELMSMIDDHRFKYIRHERNIGANANFNYLLNHAAGEWFLLFHDDDMIDSDFIESCIHALGSRDDIGFIRTGVRSIDGDGKVLKESPNVVTGETREDLYMSWFGGKTAFFLCNTLYHTERLQSVGGFHSPNHLMEDNCALVRLLDKWSHANVESVKASYRYTYDQRTYRVPVVEWCEDFSYLLNMIDNQSKADRRDEVIGRGRRFFGRLCVRRANANASLVRQTLARLTIARYFGLHSLRHTWKRPA